MMLVAASCSDNTTPFDTDRTEAIAFGVTEQTAISRADISDSLTPDTLTLFDGEIPSAINAYVSTAYIDGSDTPISRANPAAGPDAITAFSIYAFYHPTATATPQPFFADEDAVRQDDYWVTPTIYYWPDTPGCTLDFWAMSGTEAPGVTITASQTGADDMAIDYTVPQNAAAQADLMLATTGRLNTPGVRVPLQFRHICAAVRFVVGSTMQPGVIKEITLSGIRSHGRYTTQWSGLSQATTFSISANKTTDGNETPGSSIVPEYHTLMMIPQQLADDAMLTVTFHDAIAGLDRTLTASLKGQTWRQGTVTTYRIGISSELEIEFTQPVDVQDANYVICNSAVRISGIAAEKAWTLTVSASDGSDPSVQLTADINEYAKNGFWTDKRMTNGQTITSVSARGTNTVKGKGPGSFPLTVFLPENISTTDRTVTLAMSIDGAPAQYTATQQITQLPPIWSGDTGWEQIDDRQSGIYGFDYTARIVYVYNDGENLSSVANRIIDQTKAVISQYNASDYTEIQRYYQIFSGYRNYVAIDYSKLNQLGTNAQSTTDGQTNTRQLFRLGGTAVTDNFIDALEALRRINEPDVQAYVRRRADDPSAVPQEIPGTMINESQMLADVLKKNRYYLNTSTEGDLTTTSALIREEDIVWYIPASGQFGGAPAWRGGAVMNAADYWSSTAGAIGYAYTGNSTSTPRTQTKSIRVARNR